MYTVQIMDNNCVHIYLSDHKSDQSKCNISYSFVRTMYPFQSLDTATATVLKTKLKHTANKEDKTENGSDKFSIKSHYLLT